MVSFGASTLIGTKAWTGLVGTGPTGWAAGAGLMILGGIIDQKFTSKLFAGGSRDKSSQPKLLGLPVNNQQAGDPRIIAFGRRVRVDVHVLWQSPKRIAQAGGGGGLKASAAMTNNAYLDCAFAVNDRQTLRIAQVTGQGKLLTYTTRNLNDITSSEITVSDSAGKLILTMNSLADPDWTSKLKVYDVVALEGFVPSSGTLDINVGYWRVDAVVTHTSTPSALTLVPASGQVVSGVSAYAGSAEAPAKVTRIDDAIVHFDWDTIDGTDVNGGDPSLTGLDYYRIRLAASTNPSHPTPEEVFSAGDSVRLSGFAPAALNVTFEVERASGVVLWLVRPTPLNAIPWNAGTFAAGTSTNNGVIAFDTVKLFPDGLFPASFVPTDHFHSGTLTQTADATIEAAEGIGNVPGFRGIAYQVYRDFNVTIFAGAIPPQMTAVVEPDSAMTWQDAIVFVCGQRGISAEFLDASGVDPIPFEGMFLRGASTGLQSMQPIVVAGQIVTQERDDVVAFFQIDNAEVVQIRNGSAYSDFMLPDGVDAKIAFEDTADADLPTYIGIRHQDPDAQYTEGYQFYGLRNPSASAEENRQEVDLSNLVLTRKQAANLAGTLMRRAYINSRQVRMQLPPNYLHVLENDLLTFSDDDGNDFTVRVTRRDVGANFAAQITGVVEVVDIDVVGSPVQTGSGSAGRPPLRLAPIVGRVLDIPPTRDEDSLGPGLLLCAGPTGIGSWAGCVVYRSDNAGADWQQVGVLSYQASLGRTTSVLDGAVPSETLGTRTLTWDTSSTVDVEFDSIGYTMPLVSTTEAAVLGGTNWFCVQAADGTFEILGVRDIVQNSATSYTFSHLLRGLRGTIDACTRDLVAGAQVTGVSFLAATDGIFHALAGLGSAAPMEFRFVPPGGDVSDVDSVPVVATWRNCRPMPVRDVTRTDRPGNDVRFTVDHWTRQNLTPGALAPYALDETFEAYTFELYDQTGTGVRFRRTITSVGSGTNKLRDKWVEFTSAELTSAGYTPGPSETYWLSVLQEGDYGQSPPHLQEL